MKRIFCAIAVVLLAGCLASAQVTKSTVEGVRNFAKVETTVACAGATTPEALAGIKKMGYASVINLRLPSEDGANLEAEAAAAKVANIPYFHIPFDSAKADPAVADRFMQVITTPANQPAFI